MSKENRINVTRPFLPALEDFIPYLEKIWNTRVLTNNGPFHQELEEALCQHLGVKYISLFSNGTLALVTALQALRISGEVITTPFSFVATTHALWWNNIRPVFVDIEPGRFTLDTERIEAAITPKTTAIMPVHVYGYPCFVDEIQHIADTYNLKVIYDAAHAFGVKVNNQSVLNFGDLSVLSFHATKVFNTFEGGAIICHDEKTKKHIDYLKNFGFAGETTVVAPGINAKMNEFQAALGLLQLKHITQAVDTRRQITVQYRSLLKDVKGLSFPDDIENVNHNYAYFPLLIEAQDYGATRDELYEELKKHQIYARRYFYPLISHFSTYKGLPSARSNNLTVAEKVAEQVICLPIYPDLKSEEVEMIIRIIKTLAND